MKGFNKILSYVILILFVFGMISMLFFFLPKNDNTVTVPEQEPSGFSVSYRSGNDEVSKKVFSMLFHEKGSYPTNYEIGMALPVSDLKGKMEKVTFDGEPCYVGSGFDDPDVKNKSYEFYGWFLDEDFTKEFDGVLGDNETGDVILYAKISTSIWTEAY